MDEQRTLDELDPPAWGPPAFDSYLVERSHELRRKPVGEFTVEDLRLMIGQQVALALLVPRSIDTLEVNPLAEGDFYAGDLLKAVLSVPKDYWRNHPEEWLRLSTIVESVSSSYDALREPLDTFRSIRP